MLYNMPSECCDEYKLIQLYQKSSVWCFAFSRTSTFELIPAVASARPGAVVTDLLYLAQRQRIERNYSPRQSQPVDCVGELGVVL